VTNNYFLDGLAFDGMRKALLTEFDRVLVFDLKGNVRKDSMRGGIPIGEEHTVFGLGAMVGIAVTFLIRRSSAKARGVWYADVDFRATRIEKIQGADCKRDDSTRRHCEKLAPDAPRQLAYQPIRWRVLDICQSRQ